MKKFGTTIHVITVILSLYATIGTYLREIAGDYRWYLEPFLSESNLLFLGGFFLFVYLLAVLIKVVLDQDFHKTYKVEFHLRTWASLLLILLNAFIITGSIGSWISNGAWADPYAQGEVWGMAGYFCWLLSVWGALVISILSLLGFAIDTLRLRRQNKNRVAKNTLK